MQLKAVIRSDNPAITPFRQPPIMPNPSDVISAHQEAFKPDESKRGTAPEGFEQLSEKYDGINAFGINDTKGGLNTLTSILITKCLYTKYSSPIGDLQGPKELCAGPHGLYFVICNDAQMTTEKNDDERTAWIDKHCYSLDCAEHIIVPEQAQKGYIIAVLNDALDCGLIDQAHFDAACQKVLTYAEAIQA